MVLIKQKQRLFWLILILGLVIIIGGLESYFGKLYYFKINQDLNAFVWDSKTLWQFKPGFSGKTFGTQVKINDGGYRGEYYPPEPKPDLRIISLGDSRTLGFRVDDDKTFSAILQESLTQSGINSQVLNAGVLGYSAVQTRARFQQLLHYKPDIAIFSSGHNDRRYLILSKPDSQHYFSYQSRMRSLTEIMGTSKILYGILYELAQTRLKQVLEKPPPLNEVSVRVPVQTFQNELNQFVQICQKHHIQPILLWLPQNPTMFKVLEEAQTQLDQHQPEQVLEYLNKSNSHVHPSAEAYYHYLMGQYYEMVGDCQQANYHFHNQNPIGSLHGEGLLRSESPYFEVFRSVADKYQIPLLSSKVAMKTVNEYIHLEAVQIELKQIKNQQDFILDHTPEDDDQVEHIANLEQFYRARYIDECHLDNLGHILIGLNLAETIKLFHD